MQRGGIARTATGPEVVGVKSGIADLTVWIVGDRGAYLKKMQPY